MCGYKNGSYMFTSEYISGIVPVILYFYQK